MQIAKCRGIKNGERRRPSLERLLVLVLLFRLVGAFLAGRSLTRLGGLPLRWCLLLLIGSFRIRLLAARLCCQVDHRRLKVHDAGADGEAVIAVQVNFRRHGQTDLLH